MGINKVLKVGFKCVSIMLMRQIAISNQQSASSEVGQTLIIILMVMVLSLATGLAVSTRTSSTIHQTANLAESEQALATAESAAEEVLVMNLCDESQSGANCNASVLSTADSTYKNFTNHSTTCNTFGTSYLEPCWKDFGNGATATVSVRNTPEVANGEPFDFYLERDDVQQIWISGASTPIDLCWRKIGEGDSAVVLTIISGTSPNYTMSKLAYDPQATTHGNGFTAVTPGNTDGYLNCQNDISLPVNTQALRVHTYYDGASVRVKPHNLSDALPYQGHVVVATGFVGGVKRTVQVTKTRPQLPGIFDYGIYSGGGLVN